MKAIQASKAMTIGQLARRSGVSIRALREYEGMGLVYRLGRSGTNYRLFDEPALWCLQVINTLRSLGLTLKEIQEISAIYVEEREKPVGPHVQQKLDRALTRIAARIAELQEIRQRIVNFKAAHAAALDGLADLELYARDPTPPAARTRLLTLSPG